MGAAGSKKKPKRKPAQIKRGVSKPRSWDKAVSVAFVRLIGGSQEAAADSAGCARRQIVEWERSPWWPDAVAEARTRWFQGGDQRTMRALYQALSDGDANTARWWADRRIPELQPPKQRLSGPDGGAIPITGLVLNADDLKRLPDEELEALHAILKRHGSGGSDSGSD